jgi:hypothetical protein
MNCSKCGNPVSDPPWVYRCTAFNYEKAVVASRQTGTMRIDTVRETRTNHVPFQYQICAECGTAVLTKRQRESMRTAKLFFAIAAGFLVVLLLPVTRRMEPGSYVFLCLLLGGVASFCVWLGVGQLRHYSRLKSDREQMHACIGLDYGPECASREMPKGCSHFKSDWALVAGSGKVQGQSSPGPNG